MGVAENQDDLILCNFCDGQNWKGNRYCVKCGRKMKKPRSFSIMFCPNCGAEHQKNDSKCPNCDIKLNKPTFKEKVARSVQDHAYKDFLLKGKNEVFCPNCRNYEYNDNFCVVCGYNLKDVLGYYPVDMKGMIANQFFLEINRNYLQIIDEIMLHYGITQRYIYHFDFNQINYMELTTCKKLISTHPCLKLEYEGSECHNIRPKNLKLIGKGNTVTISLKKEQAIQIEEILPPELKEKLILH